MTCIAKFDYDYGILGENTKSGRISIWQSLLLNWKNAKFNGDVMLRYEYDSVPIGRRRMRFAQKCWKKKFTCGVNDDLYC